MAFIQISTMRARVLEMLLKFLYLITLRAVLLIYEASVRVIKLDYGNMFGKADCLTI